MRTYYVWEPFETLCEISWAENLTLFRQYYFRPRCGEVVTNVMECAVCAQFGPRRMMRQHSQYS